MIAPFDREAVLEETIADLEALYDYHAMILSQARVGVLDWPVNDARVYMSPCLKSMLGYDDSELPDAFSEWLKHIHEEDRDRVIQELQDAVRDNTPNYQRVHRVTRRDGSSGWILFRAQITPQKKDRPGRLLGAVIDITDIRQMIGGNLAVEAQ
ncbi:MAG: PAS domain-containing protein [Planctomycetota bacterium]|nr:PAS domain-containing protein [Planctomycetota bacterium]